MRPRTCEVKIVPTEAEIQKACLEFLNLQWGVKAWRQNTGGFYKEYKGRRQFIRFGQPGQGDITGILSPGGRRIEIEIKRPGKRPAFIQEEWLREMARYGAIAFWCSSLDECERKWMESL